MAGPAFRLRVECHAGYTGEETPRRFFLGQRAVEVMQVVDAWLAPEYRYFKVIGADGAAYILRHDTVAADWDLVMFQRQLTEPQTAA